MKPHLITPLSGDPETYDIIGAAMAVHIELGCGFSENVYAAALPIEFELRGVSFSAEVMLPIHYKGAVVEIKALAAIGEREVAQVINYLKAARIRRGILLNFGGPSAFVSVKSVDYFISTAQPAPILS